MSDFLDDALGILGRVAPTLAGMIGGPFAAQAVMALETALGLPATGDKDAALQAVAKATPEQLLAIKAEDNRHAEEMKRLGINVLKLGNEDRDSARKREIALGGWATPALASVIVGGFFGLVGYIVVNKGLGVQGDSAALVGGMIGYASAKADQVVSYYFGSSSNADNATQLLARSPAIE
jgi:hypothetical protein